MKKIFWTALLVSTLSLAACGPAPTPLPRPPTATDSSSAPDPGFDTAHGVVASAKAVPAHATQMSFPITAPVKEVMVREGDLVSTGQSLLTLYSPDLELSVTVAESEMKARQLEYVYWVPRLDRPPERREQARAEAEQAKAKLEIAQAMLAQTVLRAPFNATVVEIKIQPGEVAQAGQVVITLGDLADMQIETTDLSERDVARVQPGGSVDVFVQVLDRHLTGKVLRVSPISNTVGGDVVYPVIIALDEPPTGLLWGMSAEVDIQSAP